MAGKGRPAPRATVRSREDTKRERRAEAKVERQRTLRKRAAVRAARRASVVAAGLVVAIALVVVVVRGGGSGSVAFAGDIRTGGTLQSLELPALKGGGSITYDQFRSKPLVLNFFASWCPYCVGEMPGFQQVHRELGSNVAFLGVSQSDARSASIALADKTGVRYALGFDKNGDFYRATGSTGMPTTLFIRPGGRIAYIQVGPFTSASLKQAIQQYLGVSA
jgi:peroxiredoxin